MTTKKQVLKFAKSGFDEGAKGEDGTVWNIFVQILLPLVLLLTFVAMYVVYTYKSIADTEMQRADDYRQQLEEKLEDLDPQKEHLQKQYYLIDLQLQKLLTALQDTKRETWQELRLFLFPDARRIQIQGIKVEDSDFQYLCNESKRIFDDDGEQDLRQDIYNEVLKKSEIKDPEKDKSEIIYHKSIPEDDPHRVKLFIITQSNRTKIHNEIVEFVNQIEADVINLQDELLSLIYQELQQHPIALDEESQQLIMQMISPEISAKDRERLANDFYRRVTRKLYKQLEDDEYHFLNETWNKFKAL